MGLPLMLKSRVTWLSMVILFTDKGVCGQQWNVTYQPERTCGFVGGSVDMYCSYTYPSGLTIKKAYWTKENLGDSPDLTGDSNYRDRTTVDQWGAHGCHLHINSLTTSDTGYYYCMITTHTEGEKWIGTPGVYLEVRDIPQTTSLSICPPDNIYEGTKVTLACGSRPDLPVQSYSWSESDSQAALKQGKENTYTIHSIRSTEGGYYYCVVYYSTGATERSSYEPLWVYSRPWIPEVVIGPPGQITEGSRVTLTCSTGANQPLHNYYTWYKRGGQSGENTFKQLSTREKEFTFTDICSEDSGEYYCVATDSHGSNLSPYKQLHVLYPPKNTTIIFSDPDVIVKGSSVTLTCMSDANPPVLSYTWFKLNESTPVGSGQQYSIANIRSEDGGQYYCEARNKYGAENSTALPIIVNGDQSPFLSAVVGLSVCGAVGLLCVLVWMSKRCRTAAVAKRRDDQDARDYVNNDQAGNPDTQPDAVYQSLNPNTIQPDAVYQSLNPNTTQPDAVYQSLNPTTIQPDPLYQTLK